MRCHYGARAPQRCRRRAAHGDSRRSNGFETDAFPPRPDHADRSTLRACSGRRPRGFEPRRTREISVPSGLLRFEKHLRRSTVVTRLEPFANGDGGNGDGGIGANIGDRTMSWISFTSLRQAKRLRRACQVCPEPDAIARPRRRHPRRAGHTRTGLHLPRASSSWRSSTPPTPSP